MDKTDSKIRLFFEFSHSQPIQIQEVIPLLKYEEWNPQKMYYLPKHQYYYVFINDNELLSKIKGIDTVAEDIERIQEENSIRIEFNANGIDDGLNSEEDKYIFFAKVDIENFKFIYDYEKINKEKSKYIDPKIPIIYALKGKIKVLLLNEKEDYDDDNQNSTDDKNNMNLLTTTSNELTINQNKTKKNILNGIDGHWFLYNNLSKIKFLSLIRYKEITLNSNDNFESSQTMQNLSANLLNRLNTSNVNSPKIESKKNNILDPYIQPVQYQILVKDSNKPISLYQNKSCKIHNKKNEFYCKNCNDFCCLECLDDSIITHKNHKIRLLDEILIKMEEDSKALDERIINLKSIIDNEMNLKRNEISRIKNNNVEIVKKISELHDNKKMKIKQEEIRRAKILASLGTEVLRIVNDYQLKIKYLQFLCEKGDMSSYLSNYFIFKRFFENDIKKNLFILERKIFDNYSNYKKNNDNFNNILNIKKKNLMV
jgi:hypothetical protein